jgi:hypothetical protein
MEMSRRTFLKTLAAAAAVTVVPDLGLAIPQSEEPVKWVVEYENYGTSLGVAGFWQRGSEKLWHAVRIDWILDIPERDAIELCKQAIRQWYVETGQFKWRAV